MTLLAIFLVLGSQGDAEAEAVYRTLSAKIEGARTIRAEWTWTLNDGSRDLVVITGTLKAKGKDRWIVEADGLRDTRPSRSPPGVLQSDGRRVIVSGPTDGALAQELGPEAFGRDIRRRLATLLIGDQTDRGLQPGPGAEDRRLTAAMGPVKSAGKEKVGTRDTLILESTLTLGETVPLRLWVDAETQLPVKREVSVQGILLTEVFQTLVLDDDIPDATFVYQSKHRLARARATQLAESVRLYAHIAGRLPGTLEDLIRRPVTLEREIYFPPGGFILGGTVPQDPWGRPFELRADAEGAAVGTLGADGRPGGAGEDEDVLVPVPPATRRAVGAAGERLDRQFAARIELELLAAAVRAYQGSYGELPAKASALWERSDWADVWPEGGWIGGARLPSDPWGEPYRMAGGIALVRVEVNDPKSRRILPQSIRPEELARLEAAARPRLSEADRAALSKTFDALGDDDLETREQAQARLSRWGSACLELLEARINLEKDRESKSRLELVRQTMPRPTPPWNRVLASLSIGVTRGVGSGLGQASNERNASASLKTLSSAEADFRVNDRDGNRVNDFWTGDVAGLYTLKDPAGNLIKLIELSLALADAAPLEAGAARGRYVAPSTLGVPAPKAGYYFRVMTHDNSGGKSDPYAISTGGVPDLGKVHNTSAFGFCAYPAEYGVTGMRTFIISEGTTVFWKDTEGEPVLEFPSNAELAAGWHKMD